MKRLLLITLVTLVASLSLIGQPVFAENKDKGKGKTYTVIITNLTRGQVFSPPVVYSHNGMYPLFMAGYPASDELVYLAEGGMTDPLTGELHASEDVWDYNVADGPVPPGGSVSIEITTRNKFDRISMAGMLVGTNDAFFAVQNIRAKGKGPFLEMAVAYDAGSEANTEICEDIPGPPCALPISNLRSTDGAEGFVHVHAGVHGIGDMKVDPAEHDWRNPVARISVSRE